MAGTDLRIGLFGDEQVVGRLSRSIHNFGDASPWFRLVSGWMESEIGESFDREGAGKLGGRWKRLSPAYAAQKEADGYGDKPILVRDGDLRDSLTKGGGHAIRHIGPRQLVFGSTVAYGPAHQLGHGVPQRRMLGLQKKQSKQLARSLGLFIANDTLRSPSMMFGGTGGGGA